MACLAMEHSGIADLVGPRRHYSRSKAGSVSGYSTIIRFPFYRSTTADNRSHALPDPCHLPVTHSTSHHLMDVLGKRADPVNTDNTHLYGDNKRRMEAVSHAIIPYREQDFHRQGAPLAADVDKHVAVANRSPTTSQGRTHSSSVDCRARLALSAR